MAHINQICRKEVDTQMDNELNEITQKVQSLSTTSDVLNTTEEVKEFNNLIESSESKKQNIQSNSEIYEKLLTQKIPKDEQQEMNNN